jgi:uncharacterized membrane protein YqaE (UPF0057 family)
MKKTYLLLIGLCLSFLMPSTFAASASPAPLAPLTAVEMEDMESHSMTRAEKRAMRKQARELRKEMKDDSDVLAIILAILIPPLGVWLYEDDITVNFWVALVLMLLGVTFLLASIFGLLVVLDVIDLAK